MLLIDLSFGFILVGVDDNIVLLLELLNKIK